MSCYEWEKGSFIIPRNQWAAFKNSILDAHNTMVWQDLAMAKELVAMTRLAGRGKRGVDWGQLLRRVYYESFESKGKKLHTISDYRLAQLVVSEKSGKLTEPKKSDFPWANNTTKSFEIDDASLSFDDKSREVSWFVRENNHACDHARDTYLGRAFFNALARVKWTRNSGGYITGNDEYNEDSSDPGGGENYMKEFKGPLGDDAYERHMGISPRSMRRDRMRY